MHDFIYYFYPFWAKNPTDETFHKMLFIHQDLLEMRFVETYGITVPPKQRYLLKKTVINIAPNKQLSVRKALQLYLPCLSRLDLPWSSVYHTDSQQLNISAKYYSAIMVCLKPTLFCSGSSFPKTVLGQNKPAKQKKLTENRIVYSKGDNLKDEGQTDCWHGQWLKDICSTADPPHYTMD